VLNHVSFPLSSCLTLLTWTQRGLSIFRAHTAAQHDNNVKKFNNDSQTLSGMLRAAIGAPTAVCCCCTKEHQEQAAAAAKDRSANLLLFAFQNKSNISHKTLQVQS
jgi:hypothetical protein